MSKHNGGPAFPVVCSGDPVIILRSEGMTLRDYFASHAPEPPEQWLLDSLQENEHIIQTISAWNYAYSDAMLKARGK